MCVDHPTNPTHSPDMTGSGAFPSLPPTPFYRIREQDLLYDIELLRNSLSGYWGNFVMGYSVKTNSLPWLLSYLKKEGFYAEVVSGTEYDLACRLGFSADHIIYNGPIKDKAVLETVLLSGGYVNLDSTDELRFMEELGSQHPSHAFHVGVRVNCDLASLCPGETLAQEEGGRFGYCYENGLLKSAIDRLNAIPNVTVSGLHLHSSTQSRTVQVFGALADMAVRIAREYQLTLDYIDMGGGYFGGRADKPDYRDYFKEIGARLSTFFDPKKVTLIAEPGVSLISRAATFETSVLDIKEIRGRKYIVTDGSRVNLNPLVTRHTYPHHILYRDDVRKDADGTISGQDRPLEPTQWICGSTCMEYDRLFEIQNGPALQPGDRIIYDTAGGYTMCLSPLFIHYFPAVIIERTDGSLFWARDAWDNTEYLQKNHWE